MINNNFKFYSSKSTILTPENCSNFYNLVTPAENCGVVFQWSHLRKYYIKKDYQSLPNCIPGYRLTPPDPDDYIKRYICNSLTHYIMLFKTNEGKVFGAYINRNDLNDNDTKFKGVHGKTNKPPNETPSFLFSLEYNEILDFKNICTDPSVDFGFVTGYIDTYDTFNLIKFKFIKVELDSSKRDNTRLKGSIHFRFPLVKCNDHVLFDIFGCSYKVMRQLKHTSIEMEYTEVEIYSVKEPLTKCIDKNDRT